MTGWKIGCLLSLAALISTWSAGAQQHEVSPTAVPSAQSSQVDVTAGAYEISVPTNEPVVLVPLGVENNLSGRFVTYVVVVQTPSGAFIPLSPCNDLSDYCVPITSPAKGNLKVADPGDVFIVAEQPK